MQHRIEEDYTDRDLKRAIQSPYHTNHTKERAEAEWVRRQAHLDEYRKLIPSRD